MSNEYLYKNDTQVNTQVIVKYDTLQLGFIQRNIMPDIQRNIIQRNPIHSWVEIYPDAESFYAKIEYLIKDGFKRYE